MAYLGQVPALGNFRKLDDISSQFDGVKTEFEAKIENISVPVQSAKQCLMSLNGVIQEAGISFSNGSTNDKFKFTTAPEAGDTWWCIIIGDALDITGVSDDAVSTIALQAESVTTAKLAPDAVDSTKIADEAVGTEHYQSESITNQKIADSAVTIQKIADNAVGTDKIADAAVTASKLAQSVIDLLIPAGIVLPYTAGTPPTGFLKADGSAISRTTYSTLFSIIGTTYGVGDGVNTFNLPDLRGEFIRGFDDGRGVDTGRVLGTFQDHEIAEHAHEAGTLVTSSDGAHTHVIRIGTGGGGGSNPPDKVGPPAGFNSSTGATQTAGAHTHTLTGSVANFGGDETRPRNIALLYIIKV